MHTTSPARGPAALLAALLASLAIGTGEALAQADPWTGNAVIVALEGLVVSIQAMRLEYYEFFSKFFRGGGKTYQPFGLE